MTLQRFLNGVADFVLSRPVLRRWRPSASGPMPLRAAVALALLGPTAGLLLGGVLMGLLASGPMGGSWWPVRWLAGLGAVIGVFDAALLALAWNRRAARLRREGRTEPAPVPRRRWWQTLLVAPLYAVAVLGLTPFVLWFASDNAMGTRAWRQEHAALVARGEPTTIPELLGPPPADEDNIATTPLLKPLFDYRLVVSNRVSEFVWNDPPAKYRLEAIGFPNTVARARKSGTDARAPRIYDARLELEDYARGIRAMPVRHIENPIRPELASRYGVTTSPVPPLDRDKASALVITNAAADVLEYLKRFEPEMAELARAAERPRCRFPVHWDEMYAGQLGHFSAGKRLSILFRVRAAARLAAGDGVGALADTRTLLRVARLFSEDPLLISKLVQIAQGSIAIQGVWEGLAARQWDDTQIAGLQAMLSQLDLRDAMVAGWRGERIMGNAMYDGMLGGAAPGLPPAADGSVAFFGVPMSPPLVAPHGFLRRNQVNHNRLLDTLIHEVRSPDWPANVTNQMTTEARLEALGFRPMTPETILPSMLLPALDKANAKCARQVVAVRLAETACALERFRLRHGRFPARLDELVPAFASADPVDPMNHGPLRYQLTDGGGYRLWSVGLNGRDDDGIMKPREENDREGDWVWPSPEPGTEPTLFGG